MRAWMASLLLLTLAACGGKGNPLAHDMDGDGYPDEEDCDAESAGVHPDAEERCNGLDDDCDGETDEIGAVDGLWGVLDPDGDGVGSGDPVQFCAGAEGVSFNGGDCDESDPAISPLAEERCDGLDNDCDGEADEAGAVDGEPWPTDSDGDGYGHPINTSLACGPGDGVAESADDCDDADPLRNPGRAEVCLNEQDDDCDGVVDETDDPNTPVWYADLDGDGYGGSDETISQCAAPTGYLATAADCDDTDPEVHPGGGDDDADDIDNDCDGEIDERGDADGEGEITWTVETSSGRTTICRLVWDARWEEVYPPPFGNYAWTAAQTFDARASDDALSCEHELNGEDFTWTLAFTWSTYGYDPESLWIRDSVGLWLPLFGASLRRNHDEVTFSSTTEEEGRAYIFEGDIDIPGL